MGFARPISKRPTNITLDEHLVRQVRALTPNLSATVEQLLREFVARKHAEHDAEDAAVTAIIDRFNVLHEQHGLLSDQFQSI